jgi:hypothetical protein
MKMSLCLIKHYAIKMYGGIKTESSYSLNLGTARGGDQLFPKVTEPLGAGLASRAV